MHLKKVKLNPEKYPTRDHYPFNLELFQKTRNILLDTPVTFFVGENGSGKSTLLEAITRKCGIYIWQGILRPRYNASPYEDALYQTISIEWTNGRRVNGSFFGSDIFNNFARILDEWLTMDPGLLELLKEAGRSGQAQFIIASHSPILLACPGARILTFDDVPVRKIDYKDTNHYRIYRDFMVNPQKYIS